MSSNKMSTQKTNLTSVKSKKVHSDLYMYLWITLLGVVLICAKGTEYAIPWCNELAHKWFPNIVGDQFLFVTFAGYFFGVTYLLSTTFSEVWGFGASRKTCMFNYVINLALVLFVFAAEWQSGADLTTGKWRNLAGSLVGGFVSVMVADLLGDIIFQKLREKNSESKWYWLRAGIAAVLADIVDALLFTILFQKIAFGTPWSMIWVTLVFYIPIKTGSKLIILPFAQLFTKKVREIEGEDAFEPRDKFNWLGFEKKSK